MADPNKKNEPEDKGTENTQLDDVLKAMTTMGTQMVAMQTRFDAIDAEKKVALEKAEAEAEAKKLEDAKGKENKKDDGKDNPAPAGLTAMDIISILDARDSKNELKNIVSSVTADENTAITALGLDASKMDASALKGMLELLRKGTDNKKDEDKSFFSNKGGKNVGSVDTSVSAKIAQLKKMKNGGK